jgi:o-succinylbenzoate synthase
MTVDLVATPCARFAIEAAGYDLTARRAGRSLADEIRIRAGQIDPAQKTVAVQGLIGGETPRSVAQSARASQEAGFQAFKLKLSVSKDRRDWARDVERVSALRSVVGARARVRLDANEAWDREEAVAALAALERFEIDYVEQPVRRDDLAGLEMLMREGAIAIAADEALLGSGLAACLDARAAQILVVKPAAIGGLSNSIALWQRAQREGLRVIWSTLIDGSVGRAAASALASALGPEGEVHGLGTADLLRVDLAPNGALDRLDPHGRICISDRAGIGFDPEIPAASPKDRDPFDERYGPDTLRPLGRPAFEIRN